jgi:hypothetical protein
MSSGSEVKQREEMTKSSLRPNSTVCLNESKFGTRKGNPSNFALEPDSGYKSPLSEQNVIVCYVYFLQALPCTMTTGSHSFTSEDRLEHGWRKLQW